MPGKTISYLEWSCSLVSYVDENAESLLAQWQTVLDTSVDADLLPLPAPTTEQSLSVEHYILSTEQSKQLIVQATECYHQSAEELVLASIYLALAKAFNLKQIGIDVEWHGRDENFAGPQGIERSVGWFTSVHPLFMSVEADVNLTDWLINLKETRASVQDRGRDFYSLRYLSANQHVRDAFDEYRAPQVLFNFSGVIQRSNKEWQSVPVVAIEMGEGNKNPYALSVESEIRDNQLRIGLYIDKNLWQEDQLVKFKREIGQSIDAIITHCSDRKNSRWTPADFELMSLNLSQLNQLPANVQDVYPLTDMQQTMYRHEETYQVWMHYEMPRKFKQAVFEEAVASWIGRHDCLRTVIKTWDDDTVAQLVLTDIEPRVEVHHIDAQDAQQYADELIQKDRQNSVSVTLAAPHKLFVLDSGKDKFSLILSIHHIIHDGWSIELLLNDLFETYLFLLGESKRLPNAPIATVKDLVVTQQVQASDKQWQNYWQNLPWADDYARLPRLSKGDAGESRKVELYLSHLDQALVDKVYETSRTMGVTANSLWMSAYLLMLRYLGGQQQVRCGVILNGRPETIIGVESITGCCVNTLPMLVDINAGSTLVEIVNDVNGRLMDMLDCAVFPLSHIYSMAKKQSEEVQRVLLARAFYRQPKVLLLDEATSGLDFELEKNVIASLTEFAATTIVVTHSDFMMQAADTVLWLHDGRLVSSCPDMKLPTGC